MDWNKALELAYIAPNSDCHLIVVGESKDGQPFCYEDNFYIDKIGEDSFTVCLELVGVFPFDKLEHVSFIEFSFKDRGILYYTHVELLQLELKKAICYLTLSIPEEILQHQNRQHNRAKISLRTPITLQIVGIRGLSARKGVAFSGQLLDISAGGLSFVTTNRLFYPLFLEFSFLLSGFPHPITAYGEIIRVTNFSNDSYRVAAKFRHTPESILQEIDKYCTLQ
ncbi:PilZ domain-containing protein [Paenibacillus sp. CGMCC 1.16610]|uniref:PilZ domain-containing protein n=1 Tax=Paenibacillus anseongense TaxID=2682845 RepID=A0ABW9U9B0_9BACL|nr:MULTISPECIES: PilZ domain-containing protein [Paenibacillus]MBA2940582.1 PilZ domain-containing protein [Paenibacillus sp. CGMCC 1.16610]MVQ35759.1 PilZ domain-containing protein [Paenibacillus anseongense]